MASPTTVDIHAHFFPESYLKIIEDIGAPSLHRERVPIELRASDSVPSEPLLALDTGTAKLDSLAGLLAYLANGAGGKELQAVFLALLTNVETVRDLISGAADTLTDAASAT